MKNGFSVLNPRSNHHESRTIEPLPELTGERLASVILTEELILKDFEGSDKEDRLKSRLVLIES
jgi:hypothetical protein